MVFSLTASLLSLAVISSTQLVNWIYQWSDTQTEDKYKDPSERRVRRKVQTNWFENDTLSCTAGRLMNRTEVVVDYFYR